MEGNVHGKQGTVIWLDGDYPNLEGEWVEAGNGLLYKRGDPMPSLATLARQHNVAGVDYTTSRGVLLTIPIASASPRKILFGAKKIDSPACKFAQDAFALFAKLEKKEFVGLDSPETLQLVVDAIAHVYYLTAEMLDEYDLITSADIDPIIVCLMGIDPKKVDASGNAG